MQGLIGIILSDNIKTKRLVLMLKKSAQIGLGFYIVIFFVRMVMYFALHSALRDADENHKDKGIGSFMAEYIEDATGSIIFSIILLLTSIFFYFSNIWILRITNKMMDFIVS